MADRLLDTVLLLALPASGKSEVRRYLGELPETESRRDFHMGESVQIDDFPYVHLMRRVDEVLEKNGQARVYFDAPDKSFKDPKHWGTLIELVNEDYLDLLRLESYEPVSAAKWWFDRLDAASEKVGVKTEICGLNEASRELVIQALEKEAKTLLEEKLAVYPKSLDGKTVVIEFARGGKDGSEMPLPEPFGYQHSLAKLAPEILDRASILYVWVTPEESRRKNEARTDPNDPGSILHHGVPIHVMPNDYGCDDMDWLEAQAEKPGTVTVKTQNKTFHLAVARFDNRVDKTSFVRVGKEDWDKEKVKALHNGLQQALSQLVSAQ